MAVWNLVVGVLALTMALGQGLAGVGRVELNKWPFVRTPSRGLRLAAAGFYLVVGVVLVGAAFL